MVDKWKPFKERLFGIRGVSLVGPSWGGGLYKWCGALMTTDSGAIKFKSWVLKNFELCQNKVKYHGQYTYTYMGVSLDGGTPKHPQNDHF